MPTRYAGEPTFAITEPEGLDEKRYHPLNRLYTLSQVIDGTLEDNGADEEEFSRLFFPRLQFDVVLGPSPESGFGTGTAADLFLSLFGQALSPEGQSRP